MWLDSIKNDSFAVETNNWKENFDKKKSIDFSTKELKKLKEDFESKIVLLKNWKIDSNFDWISNEIEDFRKYVENIIIQSKKIVIKQLSLEKNKSDDKERFILEMIESFNNIDDNELSLITIQEIIAQLANITWIDFVRQKNEDDNNMKKFWVMSEDKDRVVDLLKEYWNVEYKDFWQKWPVLIIYPEAHNAWDLLKNNLEAHLAIEKYYNFSATEWIGFENTDWYTNDEIKKIKNDIRETVYKKYQKKVKNEDEWKGQSLNIKNEYNELLLNNIDILKYLNKAFENNEITISTEALETLLWQTIKTIWVEPYNLDLIHKNFIKNINNASDKYTSKTKSYKDIINESIQKNQNNNSIFNNIIIKYRNYHWLKNIQKEILAWNNSRWKNFIPITLWALHAPDLIDKGRERWFSWVIYFEANAMSNNFNMKKISVAYNKWQWLNNE